MYHSGKKSAWNEGVTWKERIAREECITWENSFIH